MPEYAFDVTLTTTARVTAKTEAEARAKLRNHADCLDIGYVSPDGVTFTEASACDETDILIEVDREAV